jgi:regulator of replication initiation timing
MVHGMETDQHWEILKQRLQNLLADYRSLQQDNQQLKGENLRLQGELNRLNDHLQQRQEARSAEIQADALQQALGGKAEAVQRIDALLREIDLCIAQLP